MKQNPFKNSKRFKKSGLQLESVLQEPLRTDVCKTWVSAVAFLVSNHSRTTDSVRSRAVVGLMDRAFDLKPEVTQGCGFESRLRQEVHDCSPGAAQSAAHCSKCVHLDGLNAENTFHSSLYSV